MQLSTTLYKFYQYFFHHKKRNDQKDFIIKKLSWLCPIDYKKKLIINILLKFFIKLFKNNIHFYFNCVHYKLQN